MMFSTRVQLVIRTSRLLYKKTVLKKGPFNVVGIIRLRNEELILQDTLDHLSKFVDAIVVYDDKSSDNSVKIAKSHPNVAIIIQNKYWRKNRTLEETANRSVLMKEALQLRPNWFFYADADERFEGNIREYLKVAPSNVKGIRISLFDAYITSEDQKPYSKKNKLLNFRKYFGPERRDILMIWRNEPGVKYLLPDSREPTGIDERNIITRFYCQHYGKSLSVQQWEETCDYYINNFPQYQKKWQARKGKAIHTESDFNRQLYTWNEVKNKKTSLKIN